MNLKQEIREPHTIQRYTEDSIVIQGISYQHSTLITPNKIICPWTLPNNPQSFIFESLLQYNPEIILLGYKKPPLIPVESLARLSEYRIGFESMSLDAACRTFNLLLQEGRQIVLGVLINPF